MTLMRQLFLYSVSNRFILLCIKQQLLIISKRKSLMPYTENNQIQTTCILPTFCCTFGTLHINFFLNFDNCFISEERMCPWNIRNPTHINLFHLPGFFVKRHMNHHGLFNAKAILVDEEQWLFDPFSSRIRSFIPFPKVLLRKLMYLSD